MKFIHAADLHLDSPLRNLEEYEGAPIKEIRGATRQALKNLVNLAIKEQVTLVLLAGDIYDGDWRDYRTGLFFSEQMSKLKEANIQVVWLVGNHDAASEITKTLSNIKKLSNLHKLSESKPQTIYLNCAGTEIAVHGQGFANRSVTDNLAANYPAYIPGILNIGLLHTSLNGRPGHDNYAPCHIDDLISKNYAYFALGHVHQQEIISKEPWIVFSGNIQGRHIREPGTKGCMLVNENNTEIDKVTPHSLDVLRWRFQQIDITGAMDGDQMLETVSTFLSNQDTHETGLEAIRLQITGVCHAHNTINHNQEHWINSLRGLATDISGGRIWLEKIKFNTQNTHAPSASSHSKTEIYSLLYDAISDLTPDSQLFHRLQKEIKPLIAKLPTELRTVDEIWHQLECPATLNEIRQDTIKLLLSTLSKY
ncbi:hypothetical protein TI04_03880 [Achromatium sp. WMS2]|nr:hypothetical protein TI04_03880 [Achromatium sp. WMS2]